MDSPIRQLSASDIWQKDARKHTIIRSLGIYLFRIWEGDWKGAVKLDKLNGNTDATDTLLMFDENELSNSVPVSDIEREKK